MRLCERIDFKQVPNRRRFSGDGDNVLSWFAEHYIHLKFEQENRKSKIKKPTAAFYAAELNKNNQQTTQQSAPNLPQHTDTAAVE